MDGENKKTLIDYGEILKEFIDLKDIKIICDKLKLSQKTIYNYINGIIPDTLSGKYTSERILEECLAIIEQKKILINSIETTLK